MISRRNIRVKVMQSLYTLATAQTSLSPDKEIKEGLAILEEKLSRSHQLFITAVYYVTSIAQYAEKDAVKKAGKYLPTEADKSISTRIAANEALWQILDNVTFLEAINALKVERHLDKEWVRKLYKKLVVLPEYETYISQTEKSLKKERAILETIWEKVMLKEDDFMEFFSDELQGWEDDSEMIGMLLGNFFRKPHKANFLDFLSAEKKTYAKDLLRYTIEKEDYCMELIRPRLIGWEAERIAMIDLLLLRMAICEMLYFPTIPSRVSINEYIEVAKHYSTPQSGQFTNAILDNIVKHLTAKGLVQKSERPEKP